MYIATHNLLSMKITIWRFILVSLFFVATCSLHAQEYQYEIGPTAGMSYYGGDANGYKLFSQPEVVKGLSVRRNFSLRTALKVDLLKADVSGDTRSSGNVLPGGLTKQFTTSFFDVNAHLEYSFFSYSDTFKYKETRRFTPYIFAGVGGTVITSPANMARLNIPVGIGLKWKVFHRVNIGTELSMNLLLSDRLEGTPALDSPYTIDSQSILKNTDMYSYLKFYVTFDFYKPDCKCNKNN